MCVFKCVYTRNEKAESAESQQPRSANHAVFHTHNEQLQGRQPKTKQFELWQAVTCDVRIKSWKVRESQLGVRAGAKRECWSEWAVRVKLDRIDDDAEDERDKAVMCDCFSSQCKVSPGSSPWRRRTKCEVRQDSCDKEHIVVAESDAIHMPCSVVSFQTARRRVVQKQFANRGVCGWSVSAVQGWLCSDSGQLQERKQAKRKEKRKNSCGTRSDGRKWKYEDQDYLFEFGHEMRADVQRLETHNCTDGASRSACRLGYVSELTTRGKALPLSSIAGSSIAPRGYRKVQWKERRL